MGCTLTEQTIASGCRQAKLLLYERD